MSGAREVRSLVGEILREILCEGHEVGSESNREVYAEILEERSGNLDVLSSAFGVFSKVLSDTREGRFESRSTLVEERERLGNVSCLEVFSKV